MNKVKYVITALLGVLLAACSEEENLSQAGKTGFQVSLTESVKVESRSTPEALNKPAENKFKLKITRQSDGYEAYDGLYTKDFIQAPVGMYTLEAEHGNNPVLALDAPYYKGTTEAEVTSEAETTQITIPCKVANALASVEFDNNGVYSFDDQFESYGVRVAFPDTSVVIKNDGKSAYYQADSKPVFTFEGTLENETDIEPVPLTDELLSNDESFAAGQHLKITLKLGATSSGVRVEISKVEVKKETISETIPMEWLPKPKVEAEGFEGNALSFAETETKEAKLNLKLSSALQDIKFKFNFEDAQEQFASLDKEKDYLLSNAEDKAVIETVLGTTLPTINATEASIDLSALVGKLQTNAGATTNNAITIDVQANNRWSSEDESANLTYTLTCNKPEFSIAVQPGNVWTKTFTIDEPTVTIGNKEVLKEKLVYQYKTTEESEWHECSNGLEQVFSEVPTNKAYQVRAFYREGIASNVVDIELETPEQLPNSNMEEWNAETYGDRYSFNPWDSNGTPFWDTNNDFTTRHRNNAIGTANYNGFHAVSIVNGRTGFAAELRNTANGRANTRVEIFGWVSHEEKDYNKVAGELFTGTTNVTLGWDDTGVSTTDSYDREKNASFNSRPTALTFYYKYAPYNSDTWSAHIELLDENKNIIVQGDKTSSETKNDWTQETVPLNYAEGTTYAKCKYIYVIFKSTINEGANMPYREITQTFYVLENGSLSAHTYEPAYVGSVLTIDDISLVYDK